MFRVSSGRLQGEIRCWIEPNTAQVGRLVMQSSTPDTAAWTDVQRFTPARPGWDDARFEIKVPDGYKS